MKAVAILVLFSVVQTGFGCVPDPTLTIKSGALVVADVLVRLFEIGRIVDNNGQTVTTPTLVNITVPPNAPTAPTTPTVTTTTTTKVIPVNPTITQVPPAQAPSQNPLDPRPTTSNGGHILNRGEGFC